MMKVMKVNKSHLVPFAMLLFAAAIISITFSLNRIAITEGIPVFAFVFWQCLGATLVTFVAAVATRQLPSLRRKDLRFYLLLGTFGTAVPITLFAFAAPKVPAGAIALGLTLEPILTYGIAVLFRIDHVRLLRFAGILFGLAGVLSKSRWLSAVTRVSSSGVLDDVQRLMVLNDPKRVYAICAMCQSAPLL